MWVVIAVTTCFLLWAGSCGLEIDRDYNASINILKKGLEILREEKIN